MLRTGYAFADIDLRMYSSRITEDAFCHDAAGIIWVFD